MMFEHGFANALVHSLVLESRMAIYIYERLYVLVLWRKCLPRRPARHRICPSRKSGIDGVQKHEHVKHRCSLVMPCCCIAFTCCEAQFLTVVFRNGRSEMAGGTQPEMSNFAVRGTSSFFCRPCFAFSFSLRQFLRTWREGLQEGDLLLAQCRHLQKATPI